MAQEAVGCWGVVGLDDGVFDGVFEIGDGFALVADSEAVVARGDGGGDECSFRDGDRYWPGAVGEFNGVVFGDVADKGDASVAHGEGEVATSVEMVGNGDRWWPAQLVSVAFDVFGWVAGSVDVWVVHWSTGVEPFNGPVRSFAQVVEAGVTLRSDGAFLPFVVDCFDVVGPSVASWWPDDGFDSEVETEPYPVGERIVLVGGLGERVIDCHPLGYRQFRLCAINKECDCRDHLAVKELARSNAVRPDVCDLE